MARDVESWEIARPASERASTDEQQHGNGLILYPVVCSHRRERMRHIEIRERPYMNRIIYIIGLIVVIIAVLSFFGLR